MAAFSGDGRGLLRVLLITSLDVSYKRNEGPGT